MVLNTHGIGRKQTSILHVVHATEIATIMKFTKSLPSLTVATNRETLKQVFCISWSQSLGKLLHRMSKCHVLFPHEVFGLSVIRLKQDCAIVNTTNVIAVLGTKTDLYAKQPQCHQRRLHECRFGFLKEC